METSVPRTMVLTEHFLPVKGGSVHWLLNTYSRYKPEEVVVVASQRPDETPVDQALPFRVRRVPMAMSDWDPTVPASLLSYLRLLWDVYRLCHQHGVQQIHCAKVLPEGFVAYVSNVWNATPYLLYAHGEEIVSALTSRKLAWLLPKIYNQASAIIANSRNTKTLLRDIGIDANKIHLIHPGVEAHAFRVDDESARRIRYKHNLGMAPVLLTVGRMQRRKGQDMVLRAIPHIAQAVPQVQYVIVGRGEEFASLKALAQSLGITERVVFAGEVSDQELAAYYAACDVFIMPNRQLDADIEGFGMVFLEAGAAGKPVIGGISGGTDDAIVHEVTGLRVDGNDANAIAAAAVSLLTNTAKAKTMGEAGRRRVEREFTWEAVVEQTRQLSTAVFDKNRE
jgi:phosphatidylinositol alpha-1,6-mannosyltransferase